MDPHERLRGLSRGTGCTVCGGSLDEARIRLLAERDDLVFVELPCRSCGARTLGILTEPVDGPPRLDVGTAGELGPAEEARLAGRPPIDADDVLAMHRILADHRGDIRSLLGRGGPGIEPSDPAASR